MRKTFTQAASDMREVLMRFFEDVHTSGVYARMDGDGDERILRTHKRHEEELLDHTRNALEACGWGADELLREATARTSVRWVSVTLPHVALVAMDDSKN